MLAEQENTPEEEPKRENNTTAPIEQVSTIVQTRGQARAPTTSKSYGIVLFQVISYVVTGFLAAIIVRLENETAILIATKLCLISRAFSIHIIPMIWVVTLEPAKQIVIKRMKNFKSKFCYRSEEI